MLTLKTILLAAGLVSAKTVKIDVGKSGLAFSPSEITAAVGDVLEFHFYAKNHSVARGDFANPCHPVTTGGFFSGYMTIASGEGVSASPHG
jgi:plastocyanin